MLRNLMILGLALMVVAAVGCSNNDSPTSSGTPMTFNDTTWYDASAGVYRTQVNASSHDQAAYFSFDRAVSKAPTWDLSFERYIINTNSGASSDGGDIDAAVIKNKAYEAVTIHDTTGAKWLVDSLAYAIDNWYHYDLNNHIFVLTHYVFSMRDAEGDNLIKLRIDSMANNGMPPNMGTIYMTYYYQPTANSLDLSGQTQSVSINVGSNTVYFDFSSGQVVTPSDPRNSTAWDIGFSNYNIMTNSGPNGSGSCFAFPAYDGLGDPTDIDSFTAQDSQAPMFPDFIKSVFNQTLSTDVEEDNWYSYSETDNILTSRSYVYLIKTDTAYYKMQVDSYYTSLSGEQLPAHYSLIWNKL